MHSDHQEQHAAEPAAKKGGLKLPQVIGLLCFFLSFTCLFLWVKYDLLSDKKSSDNWWNISIEDFSNFRFGAPKLGQPADYEIITTHELKPGEVWATEKLTGKMTIDGDGHKFAVQFSGCDDFTEFNGKQSSFPSCAEAGPALIKMGEGEKKPFLVQIIKKKK